MRRFLIPFVLVAIASWFVFIYIVLQVPPKLEDDFIQINLIYLFVSGWVGITTTSSIVLYFLNLLLEATPKKRLEIEENLRPRRVFRTSLRRGAVFATTLFALGLFKINSLDNLLNSVFVVFIALLIEVYFSSR